MEVLAKKLYKIMLDKNLKKTKVNLIFLCQLAGLEFFSFTQLQKLQEQLDNFNIYFKQVSEKEFCLFNVGKLSDVKPIKFTPQYVNFINSWTETDFVYININKNNASNHINPSPTTKSRQILNLWSYLVSNAGVKPKPNIVTFKDVSHYLELDYHLKARPLMAQIKHFCQSENIPDLTRIIINASTGLPDKKAEWKTWSEELKLINTFNYAEYEDKFLNNHEELKY